MSENKRVSYNGLTFKPFIEASAIAQRVDEIAATISSDYNGLRPLVICVLNGAAVFAVDMFRRLSIDAEITFIRLKSYEGTSSTGVVKQVVGLSEDIAGRDIIVVEDIIDTGTTISRLIDDLKAMNPSSVKVATLLYKPEACRHDINPEYVGFTIPNKFIIGYGLDIDGLARNLPDIWVVDPQSCPDA
ncbi:hypoxanthine phosphoribosyltransferase [Paramuribaculum intestinale]|uniref:hypoxanthine phosphoribosyltransferase n=1 Tax=Paramuribaculum intestinale TaxID=2094151 RepID=UPI0025A96D4D|nr:hypoxanthine phosphoribosyltransferase [Paramuribaculum intestinale]